MKNLKVLFLGFFLSCIFIQPGQAQEGSSSHYSFEGKKAIYASLDSNVYRSYSNGAWKNSLKEAYLYTQGGILWRKEKHLWSTSDTNWALSTFFIYTYQTNGLPQMEAELGRVQSGWDTLQKRYFSYDSSQLPIEERIEKKITGSGQYYTYSIHRFHYSAQGQLVLDSLLVTNDQGASYVGTMYEYTYKTNGQLEMKIGWNKTGTTWNKSSKFDYVYTAQNVLMLRHYSIYMPANQTWWYYNHAEYDMDSLGNISRMRTFNHSDTFTYTPSVSATGDYDLSIPSGNVAFPFVTSFDIPPQTLLDNLVYEFYNTGTSVWDTTSRIDFYYTRINTAVSQEANRVFKVYPNPSNHILNIQAFTPGAYVIHLYSLNGRLLRELNFDGISYTLDISALKQGVYILELTNGEGHFRQKIIRQ